jgi:glucose uptake protein
VILNYVIQPQANPTLLFGGVALVVVAIILDAMAYGAHAANQRAAVDARTAKKKSSAKGVIISLISGVLMGSFYPIVQMSRQGELGLGPYTAAFIFSLGVFFSTFVFNIYFMNLPVEGEPIEFRRYFEGSGRQHLLGIAGGMIWCLGAVSNFTAASAPQTVQVGPAVSYAIGQGATLVSALWGLLVWKEFAGATSPVRTRIALMLIFFVAGLALVSIAPLYAQ